MYPNVKKMLGHIIHVQIVLRISVFSNLLKMLFISIRQDTAVVFTCCWKDDLGADSLQTFPNPLVEEKHHLEQSQSARGDPSKLRQSTFPLCTKMRGGILLQKFKLSSIKLGSQECLALQILFCYALLQAHTPCKNHQTHKRH